MSESKSPKLGKIFVLLLVLLLPSTIYLFLSTGTNHFINVPIFYPTGEVKDTIINGKHKVDSVYHTIPRFKFVNQNGDTIKIGRASCRERV